MNIIVDRLENTDFSYQDVADLLHESFQERLDSGLRMWGSRVDAGMLEDMNSQGAIFVAYIENTIKLVGVGVITINDYGNGLMGMNEYAGVSPDFKRKSIGKLLFEKRLEYATSRGCDFIMSTTAVKAKSSVAWHKKNGFKIFKFVSYRTTNYYSYIFRLDLKNKSLWRFWLPRNILLIASFVVTRLSQDENGNLTKIGQVLMKSEFLRRFCSYY